jgi:UDP-N-acetylglucosamine 3-dehydrogenase
LVRVGVVGFGKMGLLHASILSVLPFVELVAVCEKSLATRILCSKLLKGTKVVKSVKDLSALGLDAAYVTTPPGSHLTVAREVYHQQVARHVFVEKPLACSGDEARQLCAIAEHPGGVNMVGYNRRFVPTFEKAKEILDEGTLGELLYFESHAHSSDFFGIERRAGPRAATGGVLSDLGCHAIDLALWFFGTMEIESARIESVTNSDSEDAAEFRVRSGKGVDGVFSISWCKENYRLPEVELLIRGSKGEIRVSEDTLKLNLQERRSSIWHRPDLSDEASYLLGGTEYCREDEAFIKAILGERAGDPDFRMAASVDEMIEQVRMVATKND